MPDAASMSPAVPKPAHVPDALVYDFDMFADPAYLANPHDRILDVIKNAPPIFWSPRRGGHWMLISHDAIFEASRDWEGFSSEFMSRAQEKAMRAMLPADAPHIPRALPISVDPPDHTKYRLPLQAAFAPKAVAALKPQITALANQLIDRVVDRGRCEFVADIAEPLPVQVFLKMMGLPLERQPEFRAIVKEHLANVDYDMMKTISMLRNIAASMPRRFSSAATSPATT